MMVNMVVVVVYGVRVQGCMVKEEYVCMVLGIMVLR